MLAEQLSQLNLAQLNLWLDVIQWVLIGGAIGVGIFMLSVSVFTGRFKQTWIKGDWPYIKDLHEPWHEEFPMPTRIWHWINICSFVVFIATGFYIRYPFIEGGRELARYFHFIAIYAASGAWIYRFGWFMLATGDWRNFLVITKKDIPNLLEVGKFYAGIQYDYYSHVAKYHMLQRLGYAAMMLLLFPIQAYTGFALAWPKLLLGWTTTIGIFPDIATAAAWARLLHALLMRVFFAFLLVHFSLAFIYYFPNFKYFWFGIETPMPHLEEGHGHGHGHDHGQENGHGKDDDKMKEGNGRKKDRVKRHDITAEKKRD